MPRGRANTPNVPLNAGRFIPGTFDYVVGPPRKEPSGLTNAQELVKRAFEQVSPDRQTPVSRIDPKTGRRVAGAAVAVPNDRVTAIVNLLLNDDPAARMLAQEAWKKIPPKQRTIIAKEIAAQFPNAQSSVDWSPMAREIIGMLEGGPAWSKERMRAIREVAAAEGGRPGWQSEKRGFGRDATETPSFDDSSVVETAPESSLDAPAVGDISVVEAGPRKRPLKERAKAATVAPDNRPSLRAPPKNTEFLVTGEGRRVPVQLAEGEGKIGSQDYPSFQQGKKFEAASEQQIQALEEAIGQEFGSVADFREELVRANREGDSNRVRELLARVGELRSSINVDVPAKPYPVDDWRAKASETPARTRISEYAIQMAAGDPDAAQRLWSGLARAKSASPKASGLRTPEEFADAVIARMDQDRLPVGEGFDDFRQRIIDSAREQFYPENGPVPAGTEPAASGPVDKFARNRLTAGSDPKRPGDLDSWVAAERRRGPNADIGVEQEKGRDLGAAASRPGPNIPGLAKPADGAEAAAAIVQALKNKVALAVQNGFIPYRDPETGAVIRGRVTNNTTPEKLQFMLDNFPHDLIPDDLYDQTPGDLPNYPVGHQRQEVLARLQPHADWAAKASQQPAGRKVASDGPVPPEARQPNAYDPSWQEVGPGQRVRLRDQNELGFIDETIDPEDVLFNPRSQYDIEVVDDIPFLRERAQAGSVGTSDAPVVGDTAQSPQQAHQDLIRLIADPNTSEADLAKARVEYARYKQALAGISDPEHAAAYHQEVIKPLDEAAARRRAALSAASPSEPDNVADNLNAASTPIEEVPDSRVITPDDEVPDSRVVIPINEDPSVHSASNTKPQEPPRPIEADANARADAQKAPDDIEAEAADDAAKADADVTENVTTPDVKPGGSFPAGMGEKPGPGVLRRAGAAALRRWPITALGIGGALALKSVYDAAQNAPVYGNTGDTLDGPGYGVPPAPEGSMELTPEERIRRARMMLNSGGRPRLIPQTLSRPT